MGLVIPAYLIPSEMTTLNDGPVSDRLRRRIIILGSLGGFIGLMVLTRLATSSDALLGFRMVVATGVVVLATVGALFPYREIPGDRPSAEDILRVIP